MFATRGHDAGIPSRLGRQARLFGEERQQGKYPDVERPDRPGQIRRRSHKSHRHGSSRPGGNGQAACLQGDRLGGRQGHRDQSAASQAQRLRVRMVDLVVELRQERRQEVREAAEPVRQGFGDRG